MTRMDFEDIYYTMLGEMSPGYEVPGVENAFAPGQSCERAYEDVTAAYQRLRDRLGVVDEDEDVELIIDSMTTIQRELCRRMFELALTCRRRRPRIRKRT